MKDVLDYLNKHSTVVDATVVGANIIGLLQVATIVFNFLAAAGGLAWLVYRWWTRNKRED